MATRAEALADQFEQANRDAIAEVEGCSDAKWGAACPNDGRPIAVVAYHIGSGHGPISGLVQILATGQPIPSLTMEMIDQVNAEQAQQHAGCTKAEVLGLLQQNGASAAAIVRGLSDEALDRSGEVFGAPFTTEQLIQRVLIGHINVHLNTIRAAG